MPTRNEGILFTLKVRDDGTATIGKFSKSLNKVDKSIKDVHVGFKDWRKEADRSAKTSNKLTNAVKGLVVAFASWKTVSILKDTALLASRYETLNVVMETVGKNIDLNTKQLQEYQQGLQKTGISMIQSRNTLIKMIQANIDLSKSQELARVAQNAAVIGNINSSEAFERMIYGIQSGQLEMLRTIGLNVNFENSYKKVAKQLGITTLELSETQKANIRANTVLEAGVRIAGAYEASMSTAGKQLLSWQRYVEDARVTLGEAFGPATNKLIMELVDSTKQLAEVFKDKEFQENIKNVSLLIADLTIGVKDLAVGFLSLPKVANDFFGAIGGPSLEETSKAWNDYKENIKNIRKEFDKLRGIEPRLSGDQVPDDLYGFDEAGLKKSLEMFFNEIDTQTSILFPKQIKKIEKQRKAFQKELDILNDIIDESNRNLSDIIGYDVDVASDPIEAARQKMEMERDALIQATRVRIEMQRGVEDTFDLDAGAQLLKQTHDTFDKMIDLSAATAESMQNSFEDLFFDAFTGKLESLSDYVNAFGQSVLKSISAYLSQGLVQGAFGTENSAGWIGTLLGSAKGNRFAGGGVTAFENQIVSSPKVFGFAKGVGIIGEGDKPEGVLPLARTSSGDLGVQVAGGNSSIKKIDINVYNQSGEPVKVSSAQQRMDVQGMVLDLVLDGATRNVNGFADLMGLR